jgi:hypothetical protein
VSYLPIFESPRREVSVISPGFVSTRLTDEVREVVEKLHLPMISAERIARVIVRTIECPRREIIFPGYYNVFAWFEWNFPGFMDRVLSRVLPILKERGANLASDGCAMQPPQDNQLISPSRPVVSSNFLPITEDIIMAESVLSMIRPHDYEAFLKIQRHQFPKSHAAWLYAHEKTTREHQAAGWIVINVDIYPDEFSQYCQRTHSVPTQVSLDDWAGIKHKEQRKRADEQQTVTVAQ